MATRAPKLGGLLAVIGFALSCIGLLIYMWSAFGGPIPLKPTGYQFTAYYRDATQLIPETDVRMAGVDVGRVISVTQEGEVAKTVIEVDPAQAPIPADTRTILRRKTLLGEPFIQLIPGTSADQGGTMLAENGTLPVGQTETAVDLDEALRAFDLPTRRDLSLILNELAIGVRDQGSSLNAALGNLGPTTEAGAGVFETLASQRRAVRTLVKDAGATLQALSQRRGDLHELVSAGNSVLSATAARNRELRETVELLPPTLKQLRPTLDLARQVGVNADPVLHALDPASRQLTPTVRALHDLAPDLRDLFTDLGPALDAAPAGVPAFTNTLAAARPLTRQLRPALQDAVPVVQWLTAYKRELPAWLTKLGAATQSSSGADGKHILRVVIPFNLEGFGLYADKPLGSNRHNPYAKPGYLDQLGHPHLRAFDCENAGGLEVGTAPPCVEQGPFTVPAFTGDFPQLHRAP
jgi:phospholipid/cholesterol/gamma-HCH transport system substrate-binding protein